MSGRSVVASDTFYSWVDVVVHCIRASWILGGCIMHILFFLACALSSRFVVQIICCTAKILQGHKQEQKITTSPLFFSPLFSQLEACINAVGGHSEHLLWHCLPDGPATTHHSPLFSESPTTTHNWLSSEPSAFERTQQTFSQMKKFCNSQVSVVTFSGGVGKLTTVCFLLW